MSRPQAHGTVEDDVLARTLRGLWPSLPALLAAAAALCLAGAVTVLVLPGVTPLSVLLGAVLAGAPAAALVATVDEIAATGRAGVRSWWGRLRALWAFGIRHTLLAAALLALFLVALTVWRQRPEPWLLPSLGLSGGCAVLALSALPAVLALGAAREGRSGRLLWLCALHLLARRPLRFLAGPSLALLGVWAATAWSASLLLLVPAPVTVVMVTAVRTTTGETVTGETVTAEAAARPGAELPPQRRKSGEPPSSAE